MPEPATLVKRNSDADAFPVNFAKFLRTPIFKNTYFEEHQEIGASKCYASKRVKVVFTPFIVLHFQYY